MKFKIYFRIDASTDKRRSAKGWLFFLVLIAATVARRPGVVAALLDRIWGSLIPIRAFEGPWCFFP